jgi:hypothetical protein
MVAEIGLSLVPITLGLLPPGVRVRDEGLLTQQSPSAVLLSRTYRRIVDAAIGCPDIPPGSAH